MQLFNQTPLVARVDTSEMAPDEPRIGVVTAKATYRFDASGHVELETQEPLPLLVEDEPTPFGLLPSDFEPRRDPMFEVILLGQAHAPYGNAVESLNVALSVGTVRRELLVSGDRAWVQSPQAPPAITRPLPFQQMPLVYERAFGGKKLAKIDAVSEMEVFDPINPRGLGFDGELMAHGLGQMLRAPAGYPRIENYRRELPNLEDPASRIARWNDNPDPACWATLPPDVPLHAVRRARAMGDRIEEQTKVPETKPLPVPNYDEQLYRAHPDWVIPVPVAAPLIRMHNLINERPSVDVRLPDQRIVADYVIEGRSGSRALMPQRMVLLPEERRLSLLFRAAFTFPFHAGDERAFRLRIESGWYAGASSQ